MEDRGGLSNGCRRDDGTCGGGIEGIGGRGGGEEGKDEEMEEEVKEGRWRMGR